MAKKEYIEREAFREFWNKEFRHLYPNDKYLVALANFPTADVVEVVHGEWVETTIDVEHPNGYCQEKRYICPYCGRIEEEKEPYCNCGAKMDGKDGVENG